MIQRARRKRMIEKSGAKIKLGMMRHMFIVLDMSECMRLQVRYRVNKIAGFRPAKIPFAYPKNMKDYFAVQFFTSLIGFEAHKVNLCNEIGSGFCRGILLSQSH